jgi:hypothetical protein
MRGRLILLARLLLLLGMDFSEFYNYDGFREGPQELPHANRLCARLHRRAVA